MRTSAIYCGDCQRVLGDTNEFPDGCVDLIYLDPPFFSSRQYEVLWEDGYELRAFEDRWKGGIENYIAWMEPKLRECHRVLKRTGTMYLHCDWHASHHLKLLMDKIYGQSNMINEVIWKRSSAHADAKQGARHFGRVHDVILVYECGDEKGRVWNTQYGPYDEGYTNEFYKYVEESRPPIPAWHPFRGPASGLEMWRRDIEGDLKPLVPSLSPRGRGGYYTQNGIEEIKCWVERESGIKFQARTLRRSLPRSSAWPLRS